MGRFGARGEEGGVERAAETLGCGAGRLDRRPDHLHPSPHRAVRPQRRARRVRLGELREGAAEPIDGGRPSRGDRARFGKQLADLADDGDRQSERGVGVAEHRFHGSRRRFGRHLVGRDPAAGRFRRFTRQIDVLHRHAHTVDPVGDRVMHLRHQRRLASFQAFDDEELPKGSGAVERIEDEQAGQVEQLTHRPRLGKRDASDVEVDVEVGVVSPDRGTQPGGIRLDPPSEAGNVVDGGIHAGPEPIEVRGPVEDRDRAERRRQERVLLDAPHQRFGVAHLAVRNGRLGCRRFVVSHQPSLPRRGARRQPRSTARSTRRAARPRTAPVAMPATTSDGW